MQSSKLFAILPDDVATPDGMAIDDEDMLWVGIWEGYCVARFNPQTGELLSTIEVPAKNVTACAFGETARGSPPARFDVIFLQLTPCSCRCTSRVPRSNRTRLKER